MCVCVCSELTHLSWHLFLIQCLLKNDNIAKRTPTTTVHAPLPLTYLQEKLIHSVNSLSNKAN